MIRVAIVDDHPLIRRGFAQLVAGQSDMTLVAEAGDGAAMLETLQTVTADVLLLDSNLPTISGLGVLGRVKQEYPHLRVLMISVHPEDELAVRMLRAGASGYLNKSVEPEGLLRAIRHVAAGRTYVSPTLGELLADTLQRGGELPHMKLSNREYEVLRRIASGKTITEIGEELSLSVKTVSTYRSRILEKMGLRTSAELTHYAIRHNLV